MARDVHPTEHLKKKMASREITWGEILDVVHKPEVSYGPDAKGETVHQKGNLAVVVDKFGGVKTALYRQNKQWSDNDVRRRDRHNIGHVCLCGDNQSAHVGSLGACMMPSCRCPRFELDI